jgi:putative membrane protein
MKIENLLFILLLLAGLAACDNSGQNPIDRAENTVEADQYGDTQLEEDADFLAKYAEETRWSIAAAEMAAQRASNPEVQQFAGQIANDHRQLYDEVIQLAQEYQINISNTITDEWQKELDKLAGLEGEKFDEAFLKGVIKYNEDVAAQSEAIIANSDLEPVVDFAAKIKTAHYTHLQLAQEMMESLES